MKIKKRYRLILPIFIALPLLHFKNFFLPVPASSLQTSLCNSSRALQVPSTAWLTHLVRSFQSKAYYEERMLKYSSTVLYVSMSFCHKVMLTIPCRIFHTRIFEFDSLPGRHLWMIREPLSKPARGYRIKICTAEQESKCTFDKKCIVQNIRYSLSAQYTPPVL